MAADLTGDNLPDLMLGTAGGGLRFVRNTSQKAIVTAVDEPVTPWAYPNPTTGLIMVQAPLSGRLGVLSITGQAVLPDRVVKTGDEVPLDLSSLPDGVYLLRLTTDAGAVRTQKVAVWR